LDFGSTTNTTDDMTYLLAVGADMKVSDKLSFGAGLAYLLGTEEGGVANNEDETMIEVDLSMKYALAQNTTYSLGIALGMVDMAAGETDDDMFVIGNRIDVKF
jgi:long-subunit fatty acid transport protein